MAARDKGSEIGHNLPPPSNYAPCAKKTSFVHHNPSVALPSLPPYFEMRHCYLFQEAGNFNPLQLCSAACHLSSSGKAAGCPSSSTNTTEGSGLFHHRASTKPVSSQGNEPRFRPAQGSRTDMRDHSAGTLPVEALADGHARCSRLL